LVGRRGKKKALVAVGHKIIIAVYHVLNTKQTYKEPELKVNPKKQNKQVRNYINKLKKLGIDIKLDKDKNGRFFTDVKNFDYEIDQVCI
jgi:hypothetical protein